MVTAPVPTDTGVVTVPGRAWFSVLVIASRVHDHQEGLCHDGTQ